MMYVAWDKDHPVGVSVTKEFAFIVHDRVTEEVFAEIVDGVVVIGAEAIVEKKKAVESKPIRAERDRRLAETDYLMMPDYPISDTDRERVKTYRQQLRDLPAAEGFPWGGVVDVVPWPELEAVLKAEAEAKA